MAATAVMSARSIKTNRPHDAPETRMTDLIDRVKRDDPGALDALTRAIRPHVERQLARYPVSDEDRLDLVQSTLLQVIRRIRSFRGDSSFTTWLFRVTANEALMLMRTQRRQRARFVAGLDLEDLGVLTTIPVTTHDEDPASRAERERFVQHALGELPTNYRDVVVAHYHDDLGLHEIAEKFLVSESAVRSRLHRARLRLRAILEATPHGRELRTGIPDADCPRSSSS
ncbi:MAG TPA: RNA polymerase sigma factor [Polyangium sp.]|nr:RNA polymerase sigma factor [Polyangium sp.]